MHNQWTAIAVKERKPKARWRWPHDGRLMPLNYLRHIEREREAGVVTTTLKYTDNTVTLLYRHEPDALCGWEQAYGIVHTPEIEQIRALLSGDGDGVEGCAGGIDHYARMLIEMGWAQLADWERVKLEQLTAPELVKLIGQLAYTAQRLIYTEEGTEVERVPISGDKKGWHVDEDAADA